MKKKFFFFSFSLLVYLFCSSLQINAQCNEEDYLNCSPQCVPYVKDRVPKLKDTPLGTWAQKKAIQNTTEACVGCAAIINSPLAPNNGHIAYVSQVSGKTITIMESNWLKPTGSKGSCNCTEGTRTGTKKKLGIVGYYDPKK